MAFGKRGVSELERPIDGHRAVRRGDWSLSRGDVGLALCTALAVFTGVYLFAGDAVRAYGPATMEADPVMAFGYEPGQFERSYGQTRFTADNPMAMMLTMTVTSEGVDQVDSALQENCLQRLNGNAARYAQENGMVPLNTQTGARFLVCSLQVYKGRLCEAPYRTRIIAQLEEFVRAQRAGVVSVAENVRRGETTTDLAVIKTGRMPVQVVPAILGEQLRALSELSLISRADFQDDAPEELKPYLVAETGPSPCV
ncbi:hypothetical protein J2T09_003820 [Neorhizobium huautlense]|uniref:Uncharacterized protein n=1 Tax=Neorhizobium huautlense TaxID=67774 RepID=A0ABT9PXV8_9HYPH|nr:hypothetical protein [Neorhizobium huautlense]MDP9839045.1 hypothetical protein [Neorhizobium huautlense]